MTAKSAVVWDTDTNIINYDNLYNLVSKFLVQLYKKIVLVIFDVKTKQLQFLHFYFFFPVTVVNISGCILFLTSCLICFKYELSNILPQYLPILYNVIRLKIAFFRPLVYMYTLSVSRCHEFY